MEHVYCAFLSWSWCRYCREAESSEINNLGSIPAYVSRVNPQWHI